MDVFKHTASAVEEKVHVLHSLQALNLYAQKGKGKGKKSGC